MKNISSKYIIKIPNNITVLYSEKRQQLVVIGTLARKSLKVENKIYVNKQDKTIIVYPTTFKSQNSNKKKHLKAIQGTTVALIKQLFIETSTVFYQKLNLVGVGYRVFDVDNFKDQLFLLRLGFSHPVYFKVPSTLKVSCIKSNALFISGNFYYQVKQVAAQIRANKVPECYKGKGILYENEKIVLKEGKKV